MNRSAISIRTHFGIPIVVRLCLVFDLCVTHLVAGLMIPAERMKRIRPDTELVAALEEMDRDGVNQLPGDGGRSDSGVC